MLEPHSLVWAILDTLAQMSCDCGSTRHRGRCLEKDIAPNSPSYQGEISPGRLLPDLWPLSDSCDQGLGRGKTLIRSITLRAPCSASPCMCLHLVPVLARPQSLHYKFSSTFATISALVSTLLRTRCVIYLFGFDIVPFFANDFCFVFTNN